MEYHLRHAIIRDLDTVLKWIGSPEDLCNWAGPGFPYPPDRRTTWDLIEGRTSPTFSLIDNANRVIGFGQFKFKEHEWGELFSIIISPERRRQGLGRVLCLRLMEDAAKHYPLNHFSLKVYPDNTSALSLYHSLGFVECPSEPSAGSVLMKLEMPHRTRLIIEI